MKINRGLGFYLAVCAACVLLLNTATGCSLFQSMQPPQLLMSPHRFSLHRRQPLPQPQL